MTSDQPSQLIDQVIDALDLPRSHDPASLAESASLLRDDGIDDVSLTDLTTLPFVTIDNEDSRDLDQAVLVEAEASGQRVRYALADASYYVRPGSALFAEALVRGASYYTPLFALPMLPTVLSEGLVSLNPQEDRRALVFDVQLDQDGNVLGTRILRARIRSRAKLSYAGVQALYDADDAGIGDALGSTEFSSSLRELRRFGERRLQRARERNVIEFDRRETEIVVNAASTAPDKPPVEDSMRPAGRSHFEIRQRRRYRSEKYNEQLSLLVNMEGAALLVSLTGRQQQLQAVFRVHAAPLKRELETLRDTLDALAEELGLPERWRWRDGLSLADYLAALPGDDAQARRVIAVQRQVMMAQRASSYTAEPGRHHALGAASYARFSSPMREIVGIFTHKELLEALTLDQPEMVDNLVSGLGESRLQSIRGGDTPAIDVPTGDAPTDASSDDVLRDAVIASGNLAKQRQRELDKRIEFDVIRQLLNRDLETQKPVWRRGTIVGLRRDRLYVAVDTLAVDLKVYREDLESQLGIAYRIDVVAARPDGGTGPVFRLGDAVDIRASAFDTGRQRFAMALALPGPA